MTSVIPTTLSAISYFFTRGCEAMLMLMTWNLS